MGENLLQMKYHPAKKEVEFKRFAADREISVESSWQIGRIMNETKGNFVLQHQNDKFFDAIAENFNGEEFVNIEVITTKVDFEDFLQMIDYYNENNKNDGMHITATLLSELPDMDETFHLVKKHGENSVDVLEAHKKDFEEMPAENEIIKECIDNFSENIEQEVTSIREKLKSMVDSSVNLCFAGVYSAGKSALINAILGYKILPESDGSKTAVMCKIKSPKNNEVKVCFSIYGNPFEAKWNENKGCFMLVPDIPEHPTLKKIKKAINDNKTEAKHSQLYKIIEAINDNAISYITESERVDASIEIDYPIWLDDDKVQFVIYDTPGTDSNYGEHQKVLQDALSEQTNSILIFVATPTKLEGEGNNALLSYLDEAEKKDSKTSIDISRSLFVINHADDSNERNMSEIHKKFIRHKNSDRFSIELKNKKLFFTSAMYAYSAKAVLNNIATPDEMDIVREDYERMCKPTRGQYYKLNRFAESKRLTDSMIKRCDDFFEKSIKKEKNEEKRLKIKADVFYVSSGLYALEDEIKTYGKKYAAAVRAFAIINSIDKVFINMKQTAELIRLQNKNKIEDINSEIENARSVINKAINKSYSNHYIPDDSLIPDGLRKELMLDGNVVSELESATDKSVREFFKEKDKTLRDGMIGVAGGAAFYAWAGSVFGPVGTLIGAGVGAVFMGSLGASIGSDSIKTYSEENKKDITEKITQVIDAYTRQFLVKRQQVLKKICDGFVTDINDAIRSNGDISDEAKNYILNIQPYEVKRTINASEFGNIYDAAFRAKKVDISSFISDLDRKVAEMAVSIANEFEEDFRETLTDLLHKIVTDYTKNLDNYSLYMRAMNEDKRAMEQFSDKIDMITQELKVCQDELNNVIWSVKSNE